MVKIINPLGDVKVGRQGEAVYQRKYGEQIRRQASPKRAIPSQRQLEHRQLYRDALDWRKQLSLPNRRYLDGYCINNWIIDGYGIPLAWSRFALKLHLEHINFVTVDKPILVYIPPPELEIEEQTQHNMDWYVAAFGWAIHGQRLTIPNRKVTKLGFWLKRKGNPNVTIIFGIRRVSNDAIIVEQVWGNSSQIGTTPTYCELEFDTPPIINEEVRIYSAYDGGWMNNLVWTRVQNSDVKAGEYACYKWGASWTESTGYDLAYRYTFYDWTLGEGGIDWEQSKFGILHIRHPAIKSFVHKRNGVVLRAEDNLSSLDDQYLTGQVGLDIFVGDEIEATTIAGIVYKHHVD